MKGSSAEVPPHAPESLVAAGVVGGVAAALAATDATNPISVSVFCWVLQHKPCKVTEEWQFLKVYISAK